MPVISTRSARHTPIAPPTIIGRNTRAACQPTAYPRLSKTTQIVATSATAMPTMP